MLFIPKDLNAQPYSTPLSAVTAEHTNTKQTNKNTSNNCENIYLIYKS